MMLCIDGAMGEGGGQVLRTALALAMLTRTPFRIENIRAGRAKSGLLRQHLTCVEAAVAISGGVATGAALRSSCLEFTPGEVRPGEYHFSIGSAGSTMLVLQTVLLPLLAVAGPSRLVIEGGTHNPAAPPFDFIDQVWLPHLRNGGADVEARLVRRGFAPGGGGRVVIALEGKGFHPVYTWARNRGEVLERRATAIVSDLPRAVAERELVVVQEILGLRPDECHIEEVRDGHGNGNVVMIQYRCERCTELFTAFGERGKRAEVVAAQAANEAKEWLEANVPVGPHLADQLLIPLALGGPGAIRTLAPTEHTRTNMAVIELFLPVKFETQALGSGGVEICALPAAPLG